MPKKTPTKQTNKSNPDIRKRIANLVNTLPALPLVHNGKVVKIRKTKTINFDELTNSDKDKFHREYLTELSKLPKIKGEIIYPKGFIELKQRKFHFGYPEIQTVNHEVELNEIYLKYGEEGIKNYEFTVNEIHKQLLKIKEVDTPEAKTFLQRMSELFKLKN